MWLSAVIIVIAGGLAMWSLRAGSGAFVSGSEEPDPDPTPEGAA